MTPFRTSVRHTDWIIPTLVAFLGGIGCPANGTGSATDVPIADAPDTDEGADLPADLPSTATCTVLFGLPNDQTGLTAEQCRPSCDCQGTRFTPPTCTEDRIRHIESLVLLDPMAPLTEDPYAHPEQHVPRPGTVCGFQPDAMSADAYRLQTFDDAAAAREAGAVVTHFDACGLCSPLVNLAVYMRHPDLTAPVRECGINGMFLGEDEHMTCLRNLGFDEPCARIWYYNTLHTQAQCQAICMELLEAPYHQPDGTLNACLQCDEVESGDVFKAVAGRNRRNTGLPSSMCRPCAEVQPVYHAY